MLKISKYIPKEFALNVGSPQRDLRFEALSAYRGLLRAATYLPDSLARKYTYARIRSRFRTSKEKTYGDGITGRTKQKNFTIQRLTKARRSRKLLEDASDGDMDAMKTVLLKVHGREGERKRWLLKHLIQPDEETLPKDASALKIFIEGEAPAIKRGTPDQKLLNFIRSQQANQPVDAHKGKIRQAQAKIPKENIWGRPLPLSLQKSHVQKWWATTLDKLLPPVPRGEWERLRDLATGVVPIEEQPARRTPIKPANKKVSKEKPSEELLQYFQNPARSEIPTSLEAISVEAISVEPEGHWLNPFTAQIMAQRDIRNREVQEVNDKRQTKIDKKNARDNREKQELERKKLDEEARLAASLSPSQKLQKAELRKRSFRRLYATVWSLTPTMAYNEVSKKWDIEWGGQRSRAMEGAISKPTAAEEELFEGLGTLPKVLRTGPPPPRKIKRKEQNPLTGEAPTFKILRRAS